MLKLFTPNEFTKSVFDIHPEKLVEKGIKGIITDLDNTLIEWDKPNATPELIEWFKGMEKHNIKVTIVSNNNEERVKRFSDPLKIPYIHRARKPLTTAFGKALEVMDLKGDEVVVIGDQMMTDVLGGNRKGLHTILVIPVASTDGFVTRFNRFVERKIMNHLQKKGVIAWEE